MTEKIVGIRGALPPGEPVPNVVGTLEGLLARARAGDLRAFAYAAVNRDGTVVTGWDKPDTPGTVAISIENHALGSGILTLGFRYAAACE